LSAQRIRHNHRSIIHLANGNETFLAVVFSFIKRLNGGAVEDASGRLETDRMPSPVGAVLGLVPFERQPSVYAICRYTLRFGVSRKAETDCPIWPAMSVDAQQ